MGEKTLQRLLIAFLAVAAAGVAAVYLVFWQFGYHSDTALIGLIAKSILDRGHIPGFQWPIYVWKLGYQGMLFEAYAVAALFGAAGVSPRMLHVVPTVLFLVLVPLFCAVVRRSYGTTAALLSGLALAIGSPPFFFSVLRTQPNYGETFIFGMLLTLCYLRCWERWLVRGSDFDRSDYATLGAAGFIAGFALYTYGQIIFFFGSLLAHASLRYLHLLVREGAPGVGGGVLLQLLLPGRHIDGSGGLRRAARWLNVMALAGVGFGLVSFISTIQSISWQGKVVAKWFALTTVFWALVPLLLLNSVRWLQLAGMRREKVHRRGLAVFCGAFILGYAPALYYALVLRQQSVQTMLLRGDIAVFSRRLAVAAQGTLGFLNLNSWSTAGMLAGLTIAGAVGWFVTAVARAIRGAVQRDAKPAAALGISPLVFLLPVVLVGFCVSGSVQNIQSARYLLAMNFFYVLAFGVCIQHFGAAARARGARLAVARAFLAVIGTNAHAIQRSVRALPRAYPLQEVADSLERMGIRLAYGDYWYAYAISFLTREKIVVEPLRSNYSPYYGPLVSAADRVALLEPRHEPTRVESATGETVINGRRYRAIQSTIIDEVRLTTLVKLSR